MELVWDDEALADLKDIFNWIAHESPAAAKTVVDRLFSSTELLIDFPFMGHAGRRKVEIRIDSQTLRSPAKRKLSRAS
jgi:plasmid stabilization system protein ParE